MAYKKLLGLAISDVCFDVVELHIGKKKREIRRCAKFEFPADKPLEDSRELGKSLLEFLRAKHFSAHRAAVAVPAGWLLTKHKSLPPASEDSAAEILRLEAESDFTIDIDQLAIDYAGFPAKDSPSHVFMVGILKKRINWIKDTLDAAGIDCISISPASMLVAAFVNGGNATSDTSFELLLGREEAELFVRSRGGIQLMQQIPNPAGPDKNASSYVQEDAPSGQLMGRHAASEIKRLTSLIVAGGTSSSSLWIWNGSGFGNKSAADLARMLDASLMGVGSLESFGVSIHPDCEMEIEPIASVAAAIAAGESGRIEVDFLNTRLAEKPKATNLKKLVYGAVALSILIVIGSVLTLNTISTSRRANNLAARMNRISDEVAEAEYFVNTVNHASRWYQSGPNYLEFLRQLTLLFPEEGKVWVSRLNLNSDMHVVLAAKAQDEESILELLERINGSPSFSNLKTQYMRESGSGAREYSFEISFDFNLAGVLN